MQNSIMVNKESLVTAYIRSKINILEDHQLDFLTQKFSRNEISAVEFIEKTLLSKASQETMTFIESICPIQELIEEETRNPHMNIRMNISLKFNDEIKSIKGLMPEEASTDISPGSYELTFDDGTVINFDFLDAYGTIRPEDPTIVDYTLENFDYDSFKNALILPEYLMLHSVKSISEVFVYLVDEREDFDIEGVESLYFEVTNNETGMTTTIDLSGALCDEAIIETEGD